MSSINKYTTTLGETRYAVRYTKPDGKSSKKRFRTLAGAKAWRHQMEADKRAGTFVPVSAARLTFQQLLARHLAVKAGLSPNTVYQRESVARKWVTPMWGDWAVGRITRNLVELRIEELIADGVGAGTIQKAYRLLNATLNRAVEDHLLQRNPVRGIRLPRARPAQRHPYLTFEDLAELVDATDPRYRVLILFLALTGLRFGEAAALRVSALDLEARLAHVDAAFKERRDDSTRGIPRPTPSGPLRIRPCSTTRFESSSTGAVAMSSCSPARGGRVFD